MIYEISCHNDVIWTHLYDDSDYCNWLAVCILSVYWEASYVSCYATEFLAEMHKLCIMILSFLSIFIHKYMIYDMIMIYLGQPWNELRGISRYEHRGK